VFVKKKKIQLFGQSLAMKSLLLFLLVLLACIFQVKSLFGTHNVYGKVEDL